MHWLRAAALTVVLIVSARVRAAPPASQPAATFVGAIRWDAWHGDKSSVGRAVEQSLSPVHWHERLPFFAEVLDDGRVRLRGDTPAVIDREIEYAARGGLDYWAFCYYPTMRAMNRSMELYLSSERRSDVHFCLLLQSGHLGRPGAWSATVRDFLRFLREPTYRRVTGDRPLIYLFSNGHMTFQNRFGSMEKAREAFDALREASKAEGLGNPYLVLQAWSYQVAAQQARELGFDAISAYATHAGGRGRKPYAELATHVQKFWEQCRGTGMQVVPIIMSGWDRRPRVENPVPWESKSTGETVESALHFVPPTPKELADSVGDAIRWTLAHPDANPARAVIVYAWNEFDEGGWLCPTRAEGDARLRAIGEIVRVASQPSSQP